jgi:hypothetical protein
LHSDSQLPSSDFFYVAADIIFLCGETRK